MVTSFLDDWNTCWDDSTPPWGHPDITLRSEKVSSFLARTVCPTRMWCTHFLIELGTSCLLRAASIVLSKVPLKAPSLSMKDGNSAILHVRKIHQNKQKDWSERNQSWSATRKYIGSSPVPYVYLWHTTIATLVDNTVIRQLETIL